MNQPVRKSARLGLSFPYDWSNPAISDEALILNVLSRGIYRDICRVCVHFGLERVEGLVTDLPSHIANTPSLARMLDNIRKGFARAQTMSESGALAQPDRHDPPRISPFDTLGFQWDASVEPISVSVHSPDVTCFRVQKMLAQFVWESAVLEGIPFSYPEVQTLLDGVTVGGRKISDQEQVLSLAEGFKHLLAMVRSGRFDLSKRVLMELNSTLARREAVDSGVFRGEGQEQNQTPGVCLGEHGRHTPLPTLAGATELNRVFREGVTTLGECDPFERAMAFFLFGALQMFFFDGNKRTSWLMMNGVLLSHGIDAISVPAARAQEFNEKMVRFYVSKDATEMMAFLVGCHPDAEAIMPPPESMVTNDWTRP